MRCGVHRTGLRLVRAFAAAALGCCACAWAQGGTDGAIAGRVVNAAGAPVMDVAVVARSAETGLAISGHTGRDGGFLLVRLPVGSYTVSFTEAGLEAETRSAEVRLGEVTEVDTEVRGQSQVGSALQSQALRGAAAGTAAAAIGPVQLEDLPVPGGEWRSLELLGPGAEPASTADGSAGEASFRGLDPTQDSTRVDGANAEESFAAERLGGGITEDSSGSDAPDDRASGPGVGQRSSSDGGRRTGAAFTFSQSGVREFRVEAQGVADQYGSAIYGHAGGGVLTTVTRAGTEEVHGMASYSVRDQTWAAADPFSIATSYADGVVTSGVVKPRDVRQVFGGRVGGPATLLTGPIRSRGRGAGTSGRVFFFYALDAVSRDFPAVSSPGYSTFYTLSAIQSGLLKTRGVSTGQTATALNYLQSLTGTVARSSREDVNFGRLDWQSRGAGRVSAEYNRARWSNPAGARSAPVVDRAVSSLGSSFGKADMGVVRWVSFLRPSLSQELRGQYSRELQYEAAQTPLPQEPGVGPGGLPPEISIGPAGFVFGTPAGLGRRAWPDERRAEVADVLAWVHGQQLIEVGVDASAIRDFTDSLTNAEGTFSYDSGTTNGKAGGLVDWITDFTYGVNAYPNGGCPSITAPTHYFCFRSFSQSFGQQSMRFGRQEWAGFLQDDWRVSAGLTVHAGLRYEYELLPLPQQPNAGLDAVFGARGATSVFPEDRNNLGPRLGVVWRPGGEKLGRVRAGYGVYYGRLPGTTIQAALLDTAQASSVTRIRILPTKEVVCPQKLTVGFGYPCSFGATPAGVAAATTSAVVFDRRFRLPMIQQGTVAYEHAVGGDVVGRILYVMNLDRQLPDSVDMNIAPSNDTKTFQLHGGVARLGVTPGETFVIPAYTTRLNPSFGPVTDLVSNANATYHGMTVELSRSSWRSTALRGLEFHAAFTWSKAIDFGQNPGARPRVSGQFDPFNIRYDKGLSALNFPHRTVASVVWMPEGRSLVRRLGGGRVVAALARGWLGSAIFSESSGRGYSYEVFGGSRLSGGRESLNGSGGSVVLPTLGRNTLRLPDRVNLDLRVQRGLRFARDGVHLLASAEVFNATNHVNVTGVQQRAFLAGTAVNGITPLIYQDAATVATEGINEQPFGTYTSSSAGPSRAREIQFTLRLEF